MRLDVLALAATALAATARADALLTMTGNGNEKGIWLTDFGGHTVNVAQGCRNPGVPNIPLYCMDWVNKRLHFEPTGQPRRCMKELKSNWCTFCGTGPTDRCDFQAWGEVPCTWI